MLHRTSPKGIAEKNWMCLPCIEKQEPELAKNIKEDFIESPILKDLEDILINVPGNR